MNTIHATVNTRLLAKANRLFTGSLEGRIIEILQNARRAGATKVEIANQNGYVNLRDNGRGIDDFSKLLDLGGSGWDPALESSEDPAGVGIFCLAPRTVTVRSKGKVIVVNDDGWTGAAVTIQDDPDPVKVTELRFPDEPWSLSDVELHAVFCGMQVTVDGQPCTQLPFVSAQAAAYPDLGCRIEVRESHDLNPWHHSCKRGRYYGANALVNFHGQVVAFDCHLVGERHLHSLIDLTGEPTGLRLMLPARTCLVEDDAFNALKVAVELEAYRYIQRRGRHQLPFKNYVRARELGVELPEADPAYWVGQLPGETPKPVEIVMPEGFPLSGCYRLDAELSDRDETAAANVHLLAALGSFDSPFVPVFIHSDYDGYTRADLPIIDKVEVSVGKTIYDTVLWGGKLSCVDSLAITAHARDGRVVKSAVCMAVGPVGAEGEDTTSLEQAYVTPQAQERLFSSDVWYHFGGWHEGYDTYDTQADQFAEELALFWGEMLGPDENLRLSILDTLAGIHPPWQSVTVSTEGEVTIRHADGSEKILRPPPTSHGSASPE